MNVLDMPKLSDVLRKEKVSDVERGYIIRTGSTEYLLTKSESLYSYRVRWDYLGYAYNNPKQVKYFDTWKEVEGWLADLPPLLTVKRYFEGEATKVWEEVLNDYSLDSMVRRVAMNFGCVNDIYWYCREVCATGADKIVMLGYGRDVRFLVLLSRCSEGDREWVDAELYGLVKTIEC